MLKRNGLKKTILASIAVTVAMACLAGCGAGKGSTNGTSSESGSDGVVKIRIATMPYYSGVPLQVIMDEKLDEKYGFELEPISFPSGGPMAEALGSGQWDVGPIGAGGMVAIPTYNAKLIEDVESEMDGVWIMARPDSDIVAAGNTLSDYPGLVGSKDTLKGKTMLGTIGNISHYMGLNYLNKFGLEMNDVNFIHMETAQIYTSFIAGNGDLACIGSPSAAMALRDKGYKIVGGLKQQGISQQDSMLVSNEFYENNHDSCVKFMEAWLSASMLNADPNYEIQETKKFYQSGGRTDFTDESVKEECEWNTFIDPSNAYDKEMGKWMSDLVKFMADNGTMDKSVVDAMNTNIKSDILKEAIEALKNK